MVLIGHATGGPVTLSEPATSPDINPIGSGVPII
jgi:hypothetical protein